MNLASPISVALARRRRRPPTRRAAHEAPCYSSSMSRASASQEPEVDWTGVAPDTASVEPLTVETFVARLNSLTEAVAALERLKRAFDEQNGRTHR